MDSSKLEGNGRNQEICSFEKKPDPGKVCAVDANKWGPCSPENGYGYNNSQPCFFLKLNRVNILQISHVRPCRINEK